LDPSTSELYTLSLHDALPISAARAKIPNARFCCSVRVTLGAKLSISFPTSPQCFVASSSSWSSARSTVSGEKSSGATVGHTANRSEEHTSELQSRGHLVCRLL